jgi:mono/diheme cytochrome c family protein
VAAAVSRLLALGVFVLTLVASGYVASPPIVASQAPTQSDDHPRLPPGDGRDLTIRVCSQCHEPEKAADQQLDAAGWKDLVDQMAAKGAEATDAELDQIVRYLAQAFPPAR